MKRISTKATIAIATITLACFGIVFQGYISALIRPILERNNARRVLREAKSHAELQSAVGLLGAFFPLRDGSWVAIRYTDSHVAPSYSCAVAYDSAGHWFYSSHHFCGRFALYSQAEKQWSNSAMTNSFSAAEIREILLKQDPQVFALSTATNLAEARRQLVKMEFVLR